MWYNLGQFLSSTQPRLAIEAFEQAIKYDKDTQYTDQAKSFIEQLETQATDADPATGGSTTSPATGQ
jgi:hypothetical protein